MKKILWALSLMSAVTFADVHPALKSAIDKGDIKTAQNLVQKIGVQDVYCPAELSFEDAIKIYGDAFERNPSRIWKNCETDFIENMEKNACGKSVGLCKEILKRHDESEWEPFIEQIVRNNLHHKKRKINLKKDVPVKVSKKECRAKYREAEIYLEAFKDDLLKDVCNPRKKDYSPLLCTSMKKPLDDSLALVIENAKVLCEKKSMTLEERVVEEEVVTNSFWYEAEKFGAYISLKLANVFDTSKTVVSLYEKLMEGIPDTSSSNVYWAIDEIFKKDEKQSVMINLGLACHVFPNIKEYFNEARYAPIIYKGMYNSISVEENQYIKGFDKWMNFAGKNGFNSKFFDCSRFRYTNSLGYEKKSAVESIISNYAKQGFIDYWEVSFYCKRFPGLEKELQKQTEIEMYNCDVLNDFKPISEICSKNDTTFMWKYFYIPASTHYLFVCENRNWRGISQEEMATGKLCEKGNQGELVNEYVCDERKWRKMSREENATGKVCNLELNQKVVNGYSCENGKWVELRGIDAVTGEKCDYKNRGLFAHGYVCAIGGWREQSREELETHKLCTDDNLGEFANSYVCEKQGWRKQTEGEKKTGKVCTSLNSNEMSKGYVCRIRGEDSKEITWTWQKASKQELVTQRICTSVLFGKKRNGYLCDENLGWIKDFDYGKIKDKNGRSYRTVKIGKQEWMAENLGGGALYGFKEVVCPDGWEIPSKKDWIKLFNTIGGKEKGDGEFESVKNRLLAEKVGGTNEYGFSATEFDFWTDTKSKLEGYGYLFLTLKPNKKKEDNIHVGYIREKPVRDSEKDKLDGENVWFRADGQKHKVRCIKD